MYHCKDLWCSLLPWPGVYGKYSRELLDQVCMVLWYPTDHNKTLFREYNNVLTDWNAYVVKTIMNQFGKKINIILNKTWDILKHAIGKQNDKSNFIQEHNKIFQDVHAWPHFK